MSTLCVTGWVERENLLRRRYSHVSYSYYMASEGLTRLSPTGQIWPGK
jgi:hypothetical protein